MLTLRYSARLVLEFIARFKALIFMGISLGIFVFLFVFLVTPFIWGKNVERIGVTGRYRVDNLPSFLLKMIGNGLTKLNEDGTVEADLADSWETPDEGKTWIFRLKGGKKWQDGQAVTSQGIVYEFSDLTVERPDEKTIVFKLQTPFSPLPTVVSRPTFKKGLLGTGDWQVVKISLNGDFVQELTLQNKERNRKIYRFFPSEERAKLAYKLGQVDTLLNIYHPSPFTSWKQTLVNQEVNQNQVVAVFFNTQDKLLSEKSLRQALAYAIKKEEWVDFRATSVIAPSSWAYNAQVKTYDYDAGRAKELTDDLPKEIKENLSVKLATTPTLLPEAEKIAKDWNEAGIKTFVQVSSGIPSDYQAFLAIFDIPADPDQYPVWHSTQASSNISRYQNPRIDKLLEDGRTKIRLEERKKVYFDFQRFLVEDSPAIFLYHPVTYTITRK